MKNYILMLLMLLLGQIATAKEIKGTVKDQDGLPLPGVNIVVEGTTNSTQTDFDGNYTIEANEGETLLFSYIGQKDIRIIINKEHSVHVQMEEDAQALEEVVVIGYGIKREKRALSYAVTTIAPSESQLKRRKRQGYHQSIARTLQGKAAGVNITAAGGASGNATTIRIRGMNSLNNTPSASQRKRQKRQKYHQSISRKLNQKKSGFNVDDVDNKMGGLSSLNQGKEPLYIVDGVPIQKINNQVVASISPDAIDKINVYKGGKARQLFGSLANNGCVVITTKKGNYQIENDEKYAQITENKFEHVALSPLSTFSIDVDKASYSNVRRMINNGQQIPIDAVKLEEMINYFNYSYPQPTEHPFSIHTEVVETPWNQSTKLVRIGLQGKRFTYEELPASNLTFLIDVSGSMGSANKLPLLKSTFKLLANQLREKDKVSIVVYAGAAGVVLKPTRGDKKEEISNALDDLKSGGSTAGGEGIELAYKLAQQNFIKNGNNRVILATDGDFNVGASSDKAMVELIEEKRKSGVFLSVLGFGMGNYKDSKMEKLADKGNGNHAYIDTMQEAQKVFGKEFGGTLYTIAKDVKIQVEFNPHLVKGYRLIGYENRVLADEDFIDDTKDAGELGSGHTVTALYEIVPRGIESPYLSKVHDLKYSTVVDNHISDELFTVKFRYKKPDGSSSIEITKMQSNTTASISEDFSFAASVALFGMHLRKSQFVNGSDYDDILSLAEKGISNDKDGYRTEFIRLVKSHFNTL